MLTQCPRVAVVLWHLVFVACLQRKQSALLLDYARTSGQLEAYEAVAVP